MVQITTHAFPDEEPEYENDGDHNCNNRDSSRRNSLMKQRVAVPACAEHELSNIPSVRMNDLQHNVKDKK